MRTERLHNEYGTTVTEWISCVPGELDQDGVFLMQPVVAGAEGFELRGNELDDFVKRCIVALLEAGAYAAKAGSHEACSEYTGSYAKVAADIVADWRSGKVKADWDGLWFVTPL